MNAFLVDYVWLGGNDEIRYKTRTVNAVGKELLVHDVPVWNYDGSSTGQAPSQGDTEITLQPVYVCHEHTPSHVRHIVICATYYSDGSPLPNNHYEYAKKVFERNIEEEPWFGLEQEYFIMDPITKMPVGLSDHGDTPQGQFYCAIGAQNSYGREIALGHYLKCLKNGLKISGMNQEVAVGQWEFQIGPALGLDAGHHMMVARFLLEEMAEKHGKYISYAPKLYPNWNGSGCHLNFSTRRMRESGGIKHIIDAIHKLEKKHELHLACYGKDNEQRLTGHHETSSMKTFTFGVGTRNTSVRIGNDTYDRGYGYFEDRRPAANVDPYLVTALMFDTVGESPA